jgi:hypothetical protein
MKRRITKARKKQVAACAVKILESSIPDAGRGVFTARRVFTGERLTEYTGCVHDAGAANATSEYLHPLRNGKVIDGDPYVTVSKGCGQLVNDAAAVTSVFDLAVYVDQSFGMCNVNMQEDEGGHLYVHASKEILPGCELFYAYGVEFWGNRLIRAAVDAGDRAGAHAIEDAMLLALEKQQMHRPSNPREKRLPALVSVGVDGSTIVNSLGNPASDSECRSALRWYGIPCEVYNVREALFEAIHREEARST